MNKPANARRTSATWGAILCLLLAGASYLITSGAATELYVPYMLVAEAAYLTWAARRDGQSRTDMLAFALKLNFQAAMRTTVAFAFAVTLLFALSALPGFSAVSILKLVGRGADPLVGMAALFKMSLAASIALAAARLACVRQRGMDARSLRNGGYLRPSIRLAAPMHVVEQALAERLGALARPGAARLDTVFPASVAKVRHEEEEGQAITRVFFSFFSLRMTFSVRALDYGRTELRVWIRLRKSMRLIDLFPNPVAVIKLLDFLEEQVFAPMRLRLGEPSGNAADARAA